MTQELESWVREELREMREDIKELIARVSKLIERTENYHTPQNCPMNEKFAELEDKHNKLEGRIWGIVAMVLAAVIASVLGLVLK